MAAAGFFTRDNLVKPVALATAFLHLYPPLFGPWQELKILSVSLFLAIAFLIKPLWADGSPTLRRIGRVVDGLLIAASLLHGLWLSLTFNDFLNRAGELSPLDIATGILLIVLLLEATRRHFDLVLVGLIVVTVAYAHWGQLFPGPFAHAGAQWEYILEYIYRDSSGIYGLPVTVMAGYVVVFIMMGSILERCGAGQTLLDFSKLIAGRTVAGAGKIAVVASSLFGGVSGSATANVVTLGSLTIPLMIRTGFRPQIAAAIKAVAATGDTIMPPVMAGVAFIAAQNARVSYGEFALAALVPALMYYGCLFLFVDLEGRRAGLHGLERSEIPPGRAVACAGWWIPLPFVVLIYMFSAGYSPARAAGVSFLSLIVLVLIVLGPRHGLRMCLEGMQLGARGCAALMVVAAASGIMTSMMDAAGLGIKFTYLTVDLAGGDRTIVLLLVAAVTLILGLGLPITASYLTAAALSAPLMQDLGYSVIGSHMFILYYAALSAVTPPVAFTAFAAANIAGTNAWSTGFHAMRIGFVGYFAPFLFIERPALLLLDPSIGNTIYSVGTASIGLLAMTVAFVGYFGKELALVVRVVLAIAGLSLAFFTNPIIDLLGMGVILAILVWQWIEMRGTAAAGSVAEKGNRS